LIVIRNRIEKDMEINEDTTLNGIIIGSVIVNNGVRFYLHGMLNGNLVIKNGSKVYINGIVNGNVKNNGGYLEVYGIINGKLVRESGQTIVDEDANIKEIIN